MSENARFTEVIYAIKILLRKREDAPGLTAQRSLLKNMEDFMKLENSRMKNV